ncbi:MAG: tol-pal system-associated acyl-CoA thioesterase [Rhodospirillaceae bacterium]
MTLPPAPGSIEDTPPMPTSGVLAGECHRYPVRIHWENTDAGGIVYHSEYLKFCERARTELLRLVGIAQEKMMQEAKVAFAVAKLTIDYRRPAVLDDILIVETRSHSMGAASMILQQTLLRGSEVIADVSVRIACLNLVSGGPARIPASVRSRLTALESLSQEAQSGTSSGASTSPSKPNTPSHP